VDDLPMANPNHANRDLISYSDEESSGDDSDEEEDEEEDDDNDEEDEDSSESEESELAEKVRGTSICSKNRRVAK